METKLTTSGPTPVFDPAGLAREKLLASSSRGSRLPVMVCGIAGVSGFNLFHWLNQRYPGKVIGQRPDRNWRIEGQGIWGSDLSAVDDVRRLIEENGIRTVINCGGSCALKACECDPAMAQRLNVTHVGCLLDAIEGLDVRLVHLSIDLVFSGDGSGEYVETDTPDPVTVYGSTMVQAERLVMQRREDACILRISLPMGVSFNGHAGAIDWIQARFAKGRPATLYFDEVRTPTYVDCLNEVIEEVAVGDMAGIYHAGGPRRLSLYQIAQVVNRVGGYDPDLLIGCPRIDAGPMPPRAGNVTMNSSKLAAALGREPFVAWPDQPEFAPGDDRGWHRGGQSPEFGEELLKTRLYRRSESSF